MMLAHSMHPLGDYQYEKEGCSHQIVEIADYIIATQLTSNESWDASLHCIIFYGIGPKTLISAKKVKSLLSLFCPILSFDKAFYSRQT